MKNLFFKSLLIFLIMAGCAASNSNESYYEFPGKLWKRFENPVIEMEVVKPGIFYNMFAVLDYDPSIAGKDLQVSVIMHTPSGEVRSRSFIFMLHDGNGKLKTILRSDFAFAEKGICTFEFENRSQHIESPGINRIGIVLEKVK